MMSKKKNDNLLSQIYSYGDQPKSWESLIYDIYKWYLNFKIENLYVDVKLIQTSHMLTINLNAVTWSKNVRRKNVSL